MATTKGKTLKFTVDTKLPAPKPKGKVEEIAELKEALAKLPKGANILIKSADVELSVARVHVQRAVKDEQSVDEKQRRTFVTRADKEAGGLRVWAV